MKKLIALMMAFLVVSLPLTLAQVNQTTSETILEVSLPDYWNKQEIDIAGKTSPNANVELYVNGVISRINDPAFTGSEGRVAFYGVQLRSGSNEIRIVANKVKEIKKTVIVDTIKPVLTINPIKNITFSKAINFTGTASEQGILNIYYQFKKGADTTPPPKITGLHAEDVKAESIKLAWNATDEKDFFRYVVYREGVGALATVSSQRGASYTDSKVEASSKYKYQVSAIDKSANEGEKSDEIEVETLEGEAKNITRATPINVTEVIASTLVKTFNVSGGFSGSFSLDEGDGSYVVAFELLDKAKNKDVVEKELLLDTTPPKIDLISPRPGDFVFENFADQVTFRGVTEPFARVHLFIGRTPFGDRLNASFDVAGLSERLETITDSQLTAECSFAGVQRICKGGADYSTTADADGNFAIENVDLTAIAALGINIQEIEPDEFGRFISEGSETSREVARRRWDSTRVDLLFIAIDKAGKRGAKPSHINVGNCWSGDFKFDAIPLIEYQSPTFLSPERIAEGTEAIRFVFNLSKTTDEQLTINQVSLQGACDDITKNHPLTNLSCQLMPSSCPMRAISPGSSVYYGECKLKRHPGLATWAGKDWKGLFRALKGNELLFPFRMSVRYTETIPLEEVEGTFSEQTGITTILPEEIARQTVRTQTGFQTFCQPLAYTIDDSRINPKEILPDWLLYDAVDWLNTSIYYMNKAQEVVDGILRVAGFACVSGIILMFVTGVYRRWSCSFESGIKKLEQLTDTASAQRKTDCQTCLEQSNLDQEKLDKKYNKDYKNFEQKEMSDTCLKKCYPTCSGGWAAESTIYQGMRWSCDRFLGHPAPSAWTEKKKDEDLIKKAAKIADSCNSDGGVSGVYGKKEKCSALAAEFKVTDQFGREEYCLEIKGKNLQRTMYKILDKVPANDKSDGNVYELGTKEISWTQSGIYAISDDGENFVTNKQETCEDICAGKGTGKKKIKIENGNKISYEETFTGGTAGLCMPSADCQALPASKDVQGKYISGNLPETTSTSREGYTKGCFYPSNNVQKDSTKREECCCISLSGEIKKEKEFYVPSDVEHKDKLEGATPQVAGTLESGFENMHFSYRYQNIKWKAPSEATKYNPNRYIGGRDLPACFGQDNWIFDGILGGEGDEGSILILDPAKQHTSAFQCLAINQIQARIGMLKNMMTALQNCLITIRTTGTADSGVCKELFTQYVCSALWSVIQAFRDKCTPLDLPDVGKDLEIKDYVSEGISGIFESASGAQQVLGEEYGNAALNNFLGIGEEAFA
ncbi:MAG TPA: fibronectin type III domain-containing protein, partial [Candidatus Nanoarchaeia archaeon]|nr:fibronectin type III domain-containing protein [Candidatus Nanoarchaeia archaeon]